MKKKILILGGSSDIGRELAELFLKNKDCKIDLHYCSNLKISKKNKNNLNFIKADFLDTNFENTLKKFNDDYDIIINLIGHISVKTFEKFTIDSLEKTLRVNSLIPLLIIKKSIKKMIKKKWGRILNTSSVGVNFGGGFNTFEYAASKHFNEFIPKYFRDLAKKNIFYNVLKIGLTDTKLHKKIPFKNIRNRTKLLPTKKIAKPKDIADYIYFLSLNKNNFITNELINITGGE